MGYQLLEGSTAYVLQMEVNTALERGWQLYGNPFQAKNGDFYQAVTREAK